MSNWKFWFWSEITNNIFWLCQRNIWDNKKLIYFGVRRWLYDVNFINSSTPKTWNVCLVLLPLRTCSMCVRTQLCLRTCHGYLKEGIIKVLKVLRSSMYFPVRFCKEVKTNSVWNLRFLTKLKDVIIFYFLNLNN